MGRGRVGGERGARGSWAGGRGPRRWVPRDGGTSPSTVLGSANQLAVVAWHSGAIAMCVAQRCLRALDGGPPACVPFQRPSSSVRASSAPRSGRRQHSRGAVTRVRGGPLPRRWADRRWPMADAAFAGPEPGAHGRYRGTDRAAPRIRPIRSPERGRRHNALTARSAAACPQSGAQTMSARRTRAAEMGRRRGGPRRARAGSAVYPHRDGPRVPKHNSQLIGAAEHGRWGGTAVARDPSSRPPSSGP